VTADSLRILKNYIASRADLKRSETNRTNIQLMDHFLRKCEIELARAYANRREFRDSVVYNLRALRNPRAASIAHLGLAIRTLARTMAIAACLKSPSR
jgi:hypothetical protein